MPPTDYFKQILHTDRTTISKKLRSDHKLLKTSNGYSKEEVDEAIITIWSKRLRNTSIDSSWVVRNENFLPPGISQGDVKAIVQLLTEQIFFGFFHVQNWMVLLAIMYLSGRGRDQRPLFDEMFFL